MHPVTFLLIALTFLLSQNVSNPLGQELDAEDTDTEMEPPERTCKKYISNLIQGFVQGALNCLGGKMPMRSLMEIGTRFYCLFRCVLTDVGVLGANGKLDEVAALFYFQESIPEIILDVVITDAQPCLEMAANFEPSQYYCQSYSPFVQCVFNSLVRTLGPYALNCYATPGLGSFFAIINAIVPQPTPATSASAKEIRKRYAEAQMKYREMKHRNGTSKMIGAKGKSVGQILIPGNFTVPPFKPMP